MYYIFIFSTDLDLRKMANESSFTFLLEDSFSDNDKSMTEDCSSKLKISFRITILIFTF